MQGREALRPAIDSLLHASLPFTLAGGLSVAEPPLAGVLDRLDLLQSLALETRREIELLRRESAEVLRTLGPSAAVERPDSRTSGQELAVERQGPVRFFLFGAFEVRAADGAVARWTSKKARALLAYLATESAKRVPKDVLIDLFWPDSSLARGSNNLSIAVYQIRATLKQIVPTDNHGVSVQQGLCSLDPDLHYWSDVEEFQSHMSHAQTALRSQDKMLSRQHLEAAAALYRGDFLEHDLYEEWTAEPRRSHLAAYSRALAWLAADAAESGDWPKVLDYAGRIVEHEPCDEEGHRWLMRGHWELGNGGQALQQFRICSENLEGELGVSPSEETQRLFLSIRG